jgi:hypothetical protein
MKLILLWLDYDQESSSKYIEDFILFPIVIHAPSYNQWFRRYALEK